MFFGSKSVLGKSVNIGATSGTIATGKNVHVWGPIEAGTRMICKAKAVSLSSVYAIRVEGVLSVGEELITVNIFERQAQGVIHRDGIQENSERHFSSRITESRSMEYVISPEVKSVSLRFTLFPLVLPYDLFSFTGLPADLDKVYFA